MKNFEEKVCHCALNKIFGFEPRISLALLSHFTSATEIFKAGSDEIDKILGPYSKYRGMVSPKAAESAADELKRLSEQGIDFICRSSPGYPPLLKECEDAPAGLYIRSSSPPKELWKDKRLISIVGTRDISPYGLQWCEKLTSALGKCREKPVIVSGLAIGTDICAQHTALESDLTTIAVMATGPDQVYPARHRGFAESLSKLCGCGLVTDYPPQTPPLPINFLRRNRIIAGMSEATILIESRIKGGGMNTAKLAFSYNREVYALPGRIDDIASQGCNALIREKVAEPITDIDAMIDTLGLNRNSPQNKKKITTDRQILDATYKGLRNNTDIDRMCAILLEIRSNSGITVEEVSFQTGLDYSTTAALVEILESEEFIRTDILQRCSINAKLL